MAVIKPPVHYELEPNDNKVTGITLDGDEFTIYQDGIVLLHCKAGEVCTGAWVEEN